MRWRSLGWVLCAAAGVLPAQEGKWGSDDPVAHEVARRRAWVGEGLDRPALRGMLDDPDPRLRRDAAAILVARHLDEGALRARLAVETDESVLAALLPAADTDTLRKFLRPATAPDLLCKALCLLGRSSELSDEQLADALAHENPQVARCAARILVHTRVVVGPDLRTAIASSTMRLEPVLDELLQRPRADLKVWLQEVAADESLDPGLRLTALAARAQDGLERHELLQLLDGALDEHPERRRRALLAAGRLDSASADALVAAVHQKVVLDGASLEALLPCLDSATVRGERQLMGLVRDAGPESRTALLDWLTYRASPVLLELITDTLQGTAPIAPSLLRRAGPLLDAPANRERVLELLQGDDPDLAFAAFTALLDHGRYTEELFAYVAEEGPDHLARVRLLLRPPLGDRVPEQVWIELLERSSAAADEELAAWLLTHLPGRSQGALPNALRPLCAREDYLGELACRWLLAHAPEPVVEVLWAELAEERRNAVFDALRDRRAEWALALLPALEDPATQDALAALRVRLGDPAAVALVFDRLAQVPERSLRRMLDPLAAAMSAEHLPACAAALTGEGRAGEGPRSQLLDLLARRPDLDTFPLIAVVAEKDPDDLLRSEARALAYGHPDGAELRATMDRRMGTDSFAAYEEAAFDRLLALRAPLDAESARFLWRMVLVAPLADPAAEILDDMPREDRRRFAAVPLINMTWRLLQEGVSDPVAAALADAIAELQAHPNGAWTLGGERLYRMLLALHQGEDARRMLAPGIAELLLACPAAPPESLGPAHGARAAGFWDQGDYEGAVQHYILALWHYLERPPSPVQARTFLGEDWPAEREFGLAYLSARRDLAAGHAAHRRGDLDQAEAWLKKAAVFAHGDHRAEREVQQLARDLNR